MKKSILNKKIIPAALILSIAVSPLCHAKLKSPSISRKRLKISVGQKHLLTIKNKGTDKVVWSSSKKKIASVNKKGLVTAKKVGDAKITAKIKKKKLVCKVTVVKKSNKVNNSSQNQDTANTLPSLQPTATGSPVPNDSGKATPTPVPDNGDKATPSPVPDDEGKATPSPIPDNGDKATPSPVPDDEDKATPTSKPDSITDNPEDDPSSRDDGWVPGWY